MNRILPTSTSHYHQITPNELEICVLTKDELSKLVECMKKEEGCNLVSIYQNGYHHSIFKSLDTTKHEFPEYIAQVHYKDGSVIFLKYKEKIACIYTTEFIAWYGGNLASCNVNCYDLIKLVEIAEKFKYQSIYTGQRQKFMVELNRIRQENDESRKGTVQLNVGGLNMIMKQLN
jgi:hypothetical protein